jgi:hypothetical protein
MSAISDIASRREKLLAAASRCVDGDEVVDGPALGRMTDAVTKLLPAECTYDAVYKSLSPLLGAVINPTKLRDAAWAVAANVPMLKKGEAPYPPRITTTPSVVTLQVLAARRAPEIKNAGKADAFSVLFRGRVVRGFGCPLVVEWRWSSKFVAYRASRPDGFGFSRPKYNKPSTGRPYQHYSTLVGMRFTAELSAAADGRRVVENVRCGSGLRAHNQALTEMRHRTTFACPFDFTHPCHHCPKGQASCPAACHPQDIVVRACAFCGRQAEHDDYWGTGVCVRCSDSGRRSLL